MTTSSLSIAFLGIGRMGAPMVENLIRAGHRLRVWNRTPAKAEVFAGRATLASTAADAAAGADVVITMLENGPVVEHVLLDGGVVDALSADALCIDMSSIPPATARRLADHALKRGVACLDAPVSGGTVGAAQATLSIMVGGTPAAFQRAAPVFSVLGRAIHIGPAGSGQLAKLANQAIVGITIGAVAEALLLAAQGGANPEAVREALLGGFAGSRILDLHGQRMIERRFEPGAASRIQLKDLRMILDEARAENLTLPLAQRAYESFLALVAQGDGEVDHSGLLLQLEALNGVRLDRQPVTTTREGA